MYTEEEINDLDKNDFIYAILWCSWEKQQSTYRSDFRTLCFSESETDPYYVVLIMNGKKWQ